MRVLFVCTANICRSPSAQWLMLDAIARTPELAHRVEVRSAGTHAPVGAQGCSVAQPLAAHWEAHRPTPLSRELTTWADLILALSREHRSTIYELDPSARSRTFTLHQAGRISQWLVDSGTSLTARGLVIHLNSVRGRLPQSQPGHAADPAEHAGPSRRWAWRGRRPKTGPEPVHPDDVPDPHMLGPQWHPVAAEQISDSIDSLVAAMRTAQ